MRIPAVKHPVRIVLCRKERGDAEASKALVSNRLTWEVIRMVLVYRHRWAGTETFHRDGKQEWARTMLTTIGEACRAVKGELLGQLVDWIVKKLAADHWSVPQIKAVLAQT
jgi:hypothetical protein